MDLLVCYYLKYMIIINNSSEMEYGKEFTNQCSLDKLDDYSEKCFRDVLIWIILYQQHHNCLTEWLLEDGSYNNFKNMAIKQFKQRSIVHSSFIGFDCLCPFKTLMFVIFPSGEIWAYINNYRDILSLSTFIRYEGNISQY